MPRNESTRPAHPGPATASTPRLVKVHNTELVYQVGWRECLDDPRATEELRSQGHRVRVVGPMDGYGDVPAHILEPTSFGLPEPWDTVLVALGLGQCRGLLYTPKTEHRSGAISNGHALFFAPDEVVADAADCPGAIRLTEGGPAHVDGFLRPVSGAHRVPLARCTAYASPAIEGLSVVDVGGAQIDVCYYVAALVLGASHARVVGPLDPVVVTVPGSVLGVVMPMRPDELGRSSDG